jgi:hypothetical protein
LKSTRGEILINQAKDEVPINQTNQTQETNKFRSCDSHKQDRGLARARLGLGDDFSAVDYGHHNTVRSPMKEKRKPPYQRMETKISPLRMEIGSAHLGEEEGG